MSEDALIRLINLKATGVTAKQLEDKKIGRYSYCRDLLAGNKSFGEKAARKIEEKFGWPRGCLDTAEGCEGIHALIARSLVDDGTDEADNSAPSQPIPTSMPYSPANLNSAILLLGSLLGRLDQRSREIVGHLLGDLAKTPDDADDIAAKASAIASVQKPVAKDAALNKLLTNQSPSSVETQPADLDRKK